MLKQQKTKPFSGRPQSGARRRQIGDPPLCVVRLIAIGQMDDLLVVEGLLFHRQSDRIGDHIIDEIAAHRARIAEIIHLNGRRPMRRDLAARQLRIAFELDENIDAVGIDALGRFAIVEIAQIDEGVERLAEPIAHLAAVVRRHANSR